MNQTKQCTQCGQTKTLTEFSPRKELKPGRFASACKACKSEMDRKREHKRRNPTPVTITWSRTKTKTGIIVHGTGRY